MKKLTTILLVLIMVFFTQCKKDNTGSDTDVRKVKVRCEIPMGNGEKSDFTNIFNDGFITWGDGTEYIYLAIHGDNPQIIELEGYSDGYSPSLEFEAEVEEGLIQDGEIYQIWYFGNSHKLGAANYTNYGNKLTGDISVQSGKLEDIGCCHIGMTTVTAVSEDGVVLLPLNGIFENCMAIAYLDLTDVSSLTGSAIIGTGYSLEYVDGEYRFVVDNNNHKINITDGDSYSFVVLLPNEGDDLFLRTNVNTSNNTYKELVLQDGVEANKLYLEFVSDVEHYTLMWETVSTLTVDGHEYVDLGLPSGLKWAKYNVGVDRDNVSSAEDLYGGYYKWGATTEDGVHNTGTDDIQGTEVDVARKDWGGGWMMPNYDHMTELKENCTWTKVTEYESVNINGYLAVGPNGNQLFFPAAGCYLSSGELNDPDDCHYWTSTPGPTPYNDRSSYKLRVSGIDNLTVNFYFRDQASNIRPVVQY